MKEFKKLFGGKITADHKSKYAKSIHWKKGSFQNLEETDMSVSFWDIPVILYRQFTKRKKRIPGKPLTIEAFDREVFLAQDKEAKFVWFGHSAILMRISDLTILIDPMLGPDASPIAPIDTKRFSDNTLDLIDNLPKIDILIISHDHYDHLDLASIQKLKEKTDTYYVALGVGRHLESWGISSERITEFDWWDQQDISDLKITFTPTRHFSGRGLTDRLKSLWGGWALKSDTQNIWFSGDGGYGKHFKEIGDKLGPFDFGFMECGQYNEKWHPIHLFPEESVQAAQDANVKKAMPVHWAGFALAHHTWSEPAEDFALYAKEKNLDTLYPRLGQIFTLNADLQEKWWTKI